jgi:hypothetical protein
MRVILRTFIEARREEIVECILGNLMEMLWKHVPKVYPKNQQNYKNY